MIILHTNSHYIIYTFHFKRLLPILPTSLMIWLGECTFWTVKGLNLKNVKSLSCTLIAGCFLYSVSAWQQQAFFLYSPFESESVLEFAFCSRSLWNFTRITFIFSSSLELCPHSFHAVTANLYTELSSRRSTCSVPVTFFFVHVTCSSAAVWLLSSCPRLNHSVYPVTNGLVLSNFVHLNVKFLRWTSVSSFRIDGFGGKTEKQRNHQAAPALHLADVINPAYFLHAYGINLSEDHWNSYVLTTVPWAALYVIGL